MKEGKDYIGVGVGALIINDKQQVLLMHRPATARVEPDCWSKPGGAVAFGETRLEALTREIKEEIGCDIIHAYVLRVYDHILPKDGQHWLTTDFVAKISGEPTNMEPHKCDNVAWFDVHELPEHCSPDMVIACIQAYIQL